MYKAVDIANFFITVFRYDEEYPTNLKLNKLVYFAQGHALARLGRPLFDEDIYAWQFGPVVPSVYQEFKKYGREGVSMIDSELPEFSSEEAELLIDVARTYGQFTGSSLTAKTHIEGSPWSQVYDGEPDRVISKDSIKKYFEEIEPKLLTIDEALQHRQRI